MGTAPDQKKQVVVNGGEDVVMRDREKSEASSPQTGLRGGSREQDVAVVMQDAKGINGVFGKDADRHHVSPVAVDTTMDKKYQEQSKRMFAEMITGSCSSTYSVCVDQHLKKKMPLSNGDLRDGSHITSSLPPLAPQNAPFPIKLPQAPHDELKVFIFLVTFLLGALCEWYFVDRLKDRMKRSKSRGLCKLRAKKTSCRQEFGVLFICVLCRESVTCHRH